MNNPRPDESGFSAVLNHLLNWRYLKGSKTRLPSATKFHYLPAFTGRIVPSAKIVRELMYVAENGRISVKARILFLSV